MAKHLSSPRFILVQLLTPSNPASADVLGLFSVLVERKSYEVTSVTEKRKEIAKQGHVAVEYPPMGRLFAWASTHA
jgi:hypothetical protein